MNTKTFKKLIKEAVVDAIHEELPYILEEHMARQEKKALCENKTLNFTSANVPSTVSNVRNQLATQMGEVFGFSQPSATNSLKVIDAVDESTGEKVNPYLAFIEDAANNMTPMDRQGLRNLD